MFEVRATYDFADFPAMDDVFYKAAGRVSDFVGTNFAGRDHGWRCQSEIEAERIARSLRKLGAAHVRAYPVE